MMVSIIILTLVLMIVVMLVLIIVVMLVLSMQALRSGLMIVFFVGYYDRLRKYPGVSEILLTYPIVHLY